jgi:hypothetical protein
MTEDAEARDIYEPAACGFGSADSMARSFVRVNDLSPRACASSQPGVQVSKDPERPPRKKATRAPAQRRA